MGKQRKAKALRRYARALEILHAIRLPLAARRAHGENLTVTEARTLAECEAALNRTLPAPPPRDDPNALSDIKHNMARAAYRPDDVRNFVSGGTWHTHNIEDANAGRFIPGSRCPDCKPERPGPSARVTAIDAERGVITYSSD